MQGTLSGKPQLNRKINANLVFGLIQKEGPVSRAALAKKTGIRSTSISAIVQQLLDEGLVREVGRGESTGGRHPILLEVNPAGLYAAGIEIGEDELNGVIVDLTGELLATENIPLPDTSAETVFDRSDALLNKLSQMSAIGRDQFSAIGMAVPGIISKDRGAVVLSQPLGWQNVPLQEVLEDRWSTDVYVLNNAMAGAMEAYFEGKAGDVRSLLYVLVYLEHVKRPTLISLGCGIVLDGRAYFGEGHTAGEVRTDLEHPLATARNMFGEKAPDSLDELLRVSREQPELYDAVWRLFAEKIGQVIGRGLDFLSPGCVVIGTDTPGLQDLTAEPIRKAVGMRSVSGLLEEVVGSAAPAPARIVFAPLTKDTLARGAIVPRLQELSLVPLLRESVLG